MDQSSSPCENTSYGVGGGFFSFLMFSVMSSNCSMGSFRFQNIIAIDTDTGHHTKGSEALGDDVGLNIPVIVFAGPDEPSIGFYNLGNHVIDQSVIVPKSFGFKLSFVGRIINVFENVFEESIIFFKDSIFGGHIQGHVSIERKLEGRMSESNDRFFGVIHSNGNSSFSSVIINFVVLAISGIFSFESNSESSRSIDDEISSFVLIPESMSSDDDRLCPSRNIFGEGFNDDWLSENGSVKVVTDGSVGRKPHFL